MFFSDFGVFATTVKPRYNTPAYNEFPPIKHTNFGLKKYFNSNLYVGNSENLAIKHDFDQSLEMRYSGVQLYFNQYIIFFNDQNFQAL